MSRWKKTSKVWDLVEETSFRKYRCLVCKNVLSYCHGSTTHLLRHMKLHPNEWQSVIGLGKVPEKATSSVPKKATSSVPKKATSSVPKKATRSVPEKATSSLAVVPKKEISEKPIVYGKNSERKQELDNLLLQMICKDLQPLSVVKNKGFRNLTHGLDDGYCLPDIETLSNKILPGVFEKLKKQLHGDLEIVPHVAISTEFWTGGEGQTYLTVTGHFISDEWVHVSKVLETRNLAKEHTAVDLAETLKSIFIEWGIEEKIVAVVTDNSPTFVQAVGDLNYPHVPCFAHTLQLVIKKSMNRLPDIVTLTKKIREAVLYFRDDLTASETLETLQLQNNKHSIKLKRDVEKRWNSSYYMLDVYVKQIEVITPALCMLGKPLMCLTCDELSLAKEILKTLKPFEIATTEMCVEKFTTLSKVAPMILGINSNLKSSYLQELPLSKILQEEMQQQFSSWESNDTHAFSTYLDPRFKKLGLPPSGVTVVEETLRTKIQATMEVKEKPVKQDLEAMPDNDESPLWVHFDAMASEFEMQRPSSQLENELCSYNDESYLNRSGNPLEWWRKNVMLHPNLSKLARRLLCIPATCVPTRRLFSDAGDLVNARRSCLESDAINMILFINDNDL